MSLAEPIPSGRFDTKLAMSRATLTPPPVASPILSTACSGMPSSSAPNASGSPECAAPVTAADALDGSVGEEEGEGPQDKTDCH